MNAHIFKMSAILREFHNLSICKGSKRIIYRFTKQTNKRGGDVSRVRSPHRDKAFEIYKEHDGNITNRGIASILNISEKTVGGWKCKDKWDDKLNGVLQRKERSTPKEKQNKGAPIGSKRAETHGFFSKYLPEGRFIKDVDFFVRNLYKAKNDLEL